MYFTADDFVVDRRDSNNSSLKKKAAVSDKPLRRYLKVGAVPSIFSNAPKYRSRFGWLHQLSGAYYHISMRQVIERDKKKIRAVSLLKFSTFWGSDIGEVV
jgi:hypothetical protein